MFPLGFRELDVGDADNFTLTLPTGTTSIKQGEKKEVTISIDRGKEFKEDVKVKLIEESLVIEGERKRVKEEKEDGIYRSERCYGKFYRSIPLPKGANAEHIKAELTNGVLEVAIPVPELKATLREVPIVTK